MEQDKYVGLTLNHWWKVVSCRHDKIARKRVYKLVNQANGTTIDNVLSNTLDNVISGKYQISKLLSKRLYKTHKVSGQEWW